MALVILTGLAGATIVNLLVLPVMYRLIAPTPNLGPPSAAAADHPPAEFATTL